jgi:hypothetical protein
MIFRQITHDDLGCASYLIGKVSSTIGYEHRNIELLAEEDEDQPGACSRAHGAREVLHVVHGGVPLWKRLGHPIGANRGLGHSAKPRHHDCEGANRLRSRSRRRPSRPRAP